MLFIMELSYMVFFTDIWLAAGVYSQSMFNSQKNLTNMVKNLFGPLNLPSKKIFRFGPDASSARDYMLTLYKYAQGENVDFINETLLPRINESIHVNETNMVADTVVSFVNNPYVPRPNTTDEAGAMFFDISSNFVIEKTLKSKLRIYFDKEKKNVSDNLFQITVYQIIIPRRKYLPIFQTVVNGTESAWYEFDVLNATLSWIEDSTRNNGVLITCQSITDTRKTISDCGFIGINDDSSFRPFLVSFYQSGDSDEFLAEQLPGKNKTTYSVNERIRRGLQDLFPEAKETFIKSKYKRVSNASCDRHPLYIGFKDLKWSSWIIAPEGYKASYCGGECTFPLHSSMNASNHAIIQTLVHLLTPESIPKPCCAPISLESLRVLFLDEKSNVVMKNYANMKVKNCGCQ